MSIPRITQILEERTERDVESTAELLSRESTQEELLSLILLELKKLNFMFNVVFDHELGDVKEQDYGN